MVKGFCKGLDRATVRDERSRRLLEELLPKVPVEQTADPVFLYDRPAARADLAADGLGPESGAYAVISVRKIASFRDGIPVLARAVDRLAEHGVRAAFLPLGGAADAALSTDVIRACSSAPVLLPECTLEKAAAILQGARVAIGMRLHALVLAARFAVPFLAVPYDPKVTALCEDLDYPLQPLWIPGTPCPSGDAIDELVDRLVSERDGLSAQLSQRLPIVQAAAERNFDGPRRSFRRRVMDYRNTLNLPKTDFPMKADLPKREPQRVQWWQRARDLRTAPGAQRARRERGFCTTGRHMPTASCTWATS